MKYVFDALRVLALHHSTKNVSGRLRVLALQDPAVNYVSARHRVLALYHLAVNYLSARRRVLALHHLTAKDVFAGFACSHVRILP